MSGAGSRLQPDPRLGESRAPLEKAGQDEESVLSDSESLSEYLSVKMQDGVESEGL